MTPQKNASVRYKSRPSALVPFRDDSSLVALRYDQTVQAEPPIRIPPRSPLRHRNLAARPVSCIPAPSTAVVTIPPPRPPPPTEQHPALRTITSPRTNLDDPKRDSGHALTTSSRSDTLHEDSEDDDPFPYDKNDSGRLFRVIPALHVAPLRLQTAPQRSLYSENDQMQSLMGTNNNHKNSNNISQCSIPLPSPGLSEVNTVSPTSPTTPPPYFPDKPSSHFFRSFSFRSSGSSMKTSKRLTKKHPQPLVVGDDATILVASPEGTNFRSSLDKSGAPPPNRDAHFNDESSSLESPEATTAVASDRDDFFDFVNQISFSSRGSIMLGGRRPPQHQQTSTMSDADSGIGNIEATKEPEARAFLLAPSLMPKPHVNGSPPSVIVESDEPDASQGSIRRPPTGTSQEVMVTPPTEAPTTPHSPQRPPTVRILPISVERESQKVRSLYEPADGIRWEDGAQLSSFGGRLEPTVEVPSDVEENDASSQGPSRSRSQRLGPRTPALGTRESAAPFASPHADSTRHTYELAGGIEYWEDINGEDVDRYGFISPRRPATASGKLPEGVDSMRYSPRKQRNVLVRKDHAAHSGFLGVRKGPSRKGSARSLHTQASELSVASRHSNRSALRQAANLLPHNRDRKWMDEAGEMLARQPGLTNVCDDVAAGRLAEKNQHKESERTEKWRKMAKVIKPGKSGEGMVFEFDTKNPKLIERTWKGIPDRWRAAAWYSFLSTSARNSEKPLVTEEEIVAQYQLLQEQPSSDDVQIDLDVPRTINQHIMFRKRYRGGQRLLFRVLHALSLYFLETGYVQGMASLAATLLNYYDEERCFVVLVRLWELRGLNRLYQPGFAELMGALNDFEKYWLADKRVVAKSLQEHGIDPTAYGTRWYLTLFNLSIPFTSQLRIWDVFMLLGESPPDPPESSTNSKGAPEPVSSKGLEILHAASTAIVLALSERLVESEFENAMKALTSFVPIKDDELFMKVVRAEYKQHRSKSSTSGPRVTPKEHPA